MQGVGGFFLLMLIINSGFIIVHSAIPPWVIAFYWLSPFAYSIRALVINEFTSPRWDEPLPVGKTIGVAALESLDFYTERFAACLLPYRSMYHGYRACPSSSLREDAVNVTLTWESKTS
jgi:hypothetical protein